MGDKTTYSKKEISKILSKASTIQTQKDLYGDREGLTEEELITIAKEVGIDRDSLLEALQNHGLPEFDSTFNWLSASSKIQDISIIEGVVTPEIWDDIVLEIRKITGGIGKSRIGEQTHEWEQRRQEIGYKHLSVSQQNGKTKIQYVSNWAPLKFISLMMPVFFGAVATLILLKGIGIPKTTSVLFTPIGSFIGFVAGVSVLKIYFNKEKQKLFRITEGIKRIIKKSTKPQIKIEEAESISEQNQNTNSTSSRLRS